MKPYRLVSLEEKTERTVVKVGKCEFGGNHIPIIAGPCAVEDKASYLGTVRHLAGMGVEMLRGGVFKPRTSPYAFQGSGGTGLDVLRLAREETGLPVVTEVTDIRQIPVLVDYVDMLQLGSRNMHNFALLKELARSGLPILLKRGFAATVEEWLLAAEYVMAEGNSQIVLCERGIRTFEPATRNTLDISAVPLVKNLSHLPVIVDPSHACGSWRLVGPLSLASVAAGADGLMLEVHAHPSQALCDGEQSLSLERFRQLTVQLERVALAVNRTCGKK